MAKYEAYLLLLFFLEIFLGLDVHVLVPPVAFHLLCLQKLRNNT